ncbi:hypothetical protein ABKN59_010107 [Abortiporus biennis]
MRDCHPENEYHQQLLSEATKRSHIIYKVPVRDGNDSSTREFLVGGMMYASPSVIGRGAKVSVGYDMKDGVLVLLKDSWRIVAAHVHPEHEVYARLKEHKVPHVGNVVCGGDVGDNDPSTVYLRYITRKHHRRQHYRLVLKEIGRPLSEYQSEYHPPCYLSAALLGKFYRFEEDAKILHRDISPNNTVIVERPSGGCVAILIDWDLCKYKEDMMKPPTQYNRSGTYVFMSALLLNFSAKRNEVSDDLESFVHLVNWFALDHHQHNYVNSREDFAIFIEHMYKAGSRSQSQNGLIMGNPAKLMSMQSGIAEFMLPRSPVLQELIKALMKLAKDHYATVDFAALEARRNSGNTAQGTHPPFSPPDVTDVNWDLIDEDEQIALKRNSSASSSSSVPPSLVQQPPLTPFGLLYDHRAITAILRQKMGEARAEIKAFKISSTVPLPPATSPPRPPQDLKWLNTKMPDSQIDQLPQLHFTVDIPASSATGPIPNVPQDLDDGFISERNPE